MAEQNFTRKRTSKHGLSKKRAAALTASKIRSIVKCDDKHRHGSERVALRKAGELMDGGAPRLYVYRCPECRGWHLTKLRQGSHVRSTPNHPAPKAHHKESQDGNQAQDRPEDQPPA